MSEASPTGCGERSMNTASCWTSSSRRTGIPRPPGRFSTVCWGRGDVPVVIHPDKLWSYGAALRELPVLHGVEHVQVVSPGRCNNLVEHPIVPLGARTVRSEAGGHDDERKDFPVCTPGSRIGIIPPAPLVPLALGVTTNRRLSRCGGSGTAGGAAVYVHSAGDTGGLRGELRAEPADLHCGCAAAAAAFIQLHSRRQDLSSRTRSSCTAACPSTT